MDWSPFMPPKHHVNVSHESLPFTLIMHVKYVLGIFLFSHVQFQQPRTFVQHQLTIFLPASLPIIILGTSTSPWVVPLSPWPLSPSGLSVILLQLSWPLSPSHTWSCQFPKSPSRASCRDRVLLYLLAYSWNAALTAFSSPWNSSP